LSVMRPVTVGLPVWGGRDGRGCALHHLGGGDPRGGGKKAAQNLWQAGTFLKHSGATIKKPANKGGLDIRKFRLEPFGK